MSDVQPTAQPVPDPIQPIIEKTHPIGSGTQQIYRFDNGYGASVVRFSIGGLSGSYGSAAGLWELAVLTFQGDGVERYELTYDTSITEDVLGHLDDIDVQETLRRIRDLPQAEVQA